MSVTSWPCDINSAASVLSRKQLPQYISAAPVFIERIFIRFFELLQNRQRLIHALYHLGLKSRERPDVSNSVPRILIIRRLALGLIAFKETGHEELASKRRQPHSSSGSIFHESIRIVRIDNLNHRPRRRRVVDHGVVVFGPRGLVHGKPHQRVSIGRREVDSVQQLFDRVSMKLGSHLGPAAKYALDPYSLQRHFVA